MTVQRPGQPAIADAAVAIDDTLEPDAAGDPRPHRFGGIGRLYVADQTWPRHAVTGRADLPLFTARSRSHAGPAPGPAPRSALAPVRSRTRAAARGLRIGGAGRVEDADQRRQAGGHGLRGQCQGLLRLARRGRGRRDVDRRGWAHGQPIAARGFSATRRLWALVATTTTAAARGWELRGYPNHLCQWRQRLWTVGWPGGRVPGNPDCQHPEREVYSCGQYGTPSPLGPAGRRLVEEHRFLRRATAAPSLNRG